MTTSVRAPKRALPSAGVIVRTPVARPGFDLATRVDGILHRHPAIGLAVGVIRKGRLESFEGRGFADAAGRVSITQDTVFRIASITKLFTAVAIMQLVERGQIDLDAPANTYLRAYQLRPAQPDWRPATLRHLLTHSAGIPEVRGLADLRHASLTPSGGRPATLSVHFGEPLPTVAEYYRDGVGIVVEPGTAFAYSNHGFATLGQIVEDVGGVPLARYFRERIFQPLGMADTDLTRSTRIASRLATGYELGRAGLRAVPDREWVDAGAGQLYSTPRDLARFATALLGGGRNDAGRILEPATVALMFEPHFQPDPRIPGLGLGFFRGDVAGHRSVGHGGILPGFNSELLLAPDDGLGVIAFTNGSSGAFAWLRVEADRLLRELLALPEERVDDNLPHHPEVWAGLCGRYVFPPRIADLRIRLMLSGGAEVFVRDGHLRLRLLTPFPVPYGGLPLEPADAHDPYAFRLDLSRLNLGTLRVVFGRDATGRTVAVHTDLGGQPWSLVRRDDAASGRRRLNLLGALAATGAAAAAIHQGRRRQRRRRHGAMACRSIG